MNVEWRADAAGDVSGTVGGESYRGHMSTRKAGSRAGSGYEAGNKVELAVCCPEGHIVTTRYEKHFREDGKIVASGRVRGDRSDWVSDAEEDADVTRLTFWCRHRGPRGDVEWKDSITVAQLHLVLGELLHLGSPASLQPMTPARIRELASVARKRTRAVRP